MIEVTPHLSAEAADVVRDLQRMPATMGPAVARAMDRENELTLGHISERYLSRRGPQSLGVRTNRLRSSLRRTRAQISGDLGVASSIGSNVEYLGPHEFGFKGAVNVRSHQRRMTQLFGQPLAQAVTVNVRAHKRQVSIRKRAPIRRGITDRMDHYVRSISTAVVEAAEGKL